RSKLFALGGFFFAVRAFFFDARRGGNFVVVFQAQQAHTLRGTARLANLIRVDANDLAGGGDDHDIRLLIDLQRGANRAVAVGGLQVDHALAAARSDAVFGKRRALAVAFFGNGEHQGSERILDGIVFQVVEVFRLLLGFLADNFPIGQHGVHADDIVVFG